MPRQRRDERPRTPLAERIDAAARASGLTNEAIAERMGVSHGNISHWRIGRHAPDVETALRLARVLGESEVYLLTGRRDPGPVMAVLADRWRELAARVAAGEEPATVWESFPGQQGILSNAERRLLTESGPELRRYLATADGREWVPVSEEARRVVAALLRLLRLPDPEGE